MSSEKPKLLGDIVVVIEADATMLQAALKRAGEKIMKDVPNITEIESARRIFTIGDGMTSFAQPRTIPHEHPETAVEALKNLRYAIDKLADAVLNAMGPYLNTVLDPVAEARKRSREDLVAKRKAMRRGKGRL